MLRNQLASALEQPLSGQSATNPQDIIDELSTLLLGKEHKIRLAVACLLAGGHLLLEDKPGVGKTTLAQAIAKVLDLSWNRVQFTSDLLPADIVGVSIFNTQSQQFEFKPGPVFSPVLLADEVNRAPPKSQSALLEAMEERQVSVDGKTYPLADEFFVIATQNPTDNVGAYALPESQLDRFLAGIALGYPDPETERELLAGGDTRAKLDSLKGLANSKILHQWQSKATDIHASPRIINYIQSLLMESRTATRQSRGDRALSPRAGLRLLSMSKAYAMIAQRDMVLPEDVQAVFPAVAGHRLRGNVQEGQEVASQLLQSVPVD